MIDCPLLIVGLGGVIGPAIKAGFTVTVSPVEQAVPGALPCDESVTLYEKVVVEVNVNGNVDEVAPGIGDAHMLSEYHW